MTTPRKHPWRLHVAWGLLAIAALLTGIHLGMRWEGATLGSMSLDNKRMGALMQARTALAALEDGTPAALEMGNRMVLTLAIGDLAFAPRFYPCKPADTEALQRIRAYTNQHPLGERVPAASLEAALAFCDKPATPLNIP